MIKAAHDPSRPDEQSGFLADVLAGLGASPKHISGRWLWDDRGGVLFDRVTAGPDYYVARHETALLHVHAKAIADRVGGFASVVEFGSGASHKVRVLLDALDRPRRYVPIDIARAFLAEAAARIAGDYPALAVEPVCGDYAVPLALPAGLAEGPVLGFYPGNTLGTYGEDELVQVLGTMRRTLGRSHLLVGVDPTQDADAIRRGYADPEGRMAAVHRHVLERVRDELGAELDPEDFRHDALVFEDPLRTEAHMIARRDLVVGVGGRRFALAAGEGIRTDVSHKWSPEVFAAIARRAGWEPREAWVDAPARFSLHLLQAASGD